MLKAKIISSDASLNNFDFISSLEFFPGSQTRLVMRLFNPQRKDQLRYIPDSSANLEIHIPKKDGTNETVTMTAFVDDRSIWYADLQETVTEDLAGGNIFFELDELGDGSKISLGVVENAMSLFISGVSC